MVVRKYFGMFYCVCCRTAFVIHHCFIEPRRVESNEYDTYTTYNCTRIRRTSGHSTMVRSYRYRGNALQALDESDSFPVEKLCNVRRNRSVVVDCHKIVCHHFVLMFVAVSIYCFLDVAPVHIALDAMES